MMWFKKAMKSMRSKNRKSEPDSLKILREVVQSFADEQISCDELWVKIVLAFSQDENNCSSTSKTRISI